MVLGLEKEGGRDIIVCPGIVFLAPEREILSVESQKGSA